MSFAFPFSFAFTEPLKTLQETGSLTLVNVGNTTAKSYIINQILQQSSYNNLLWASTEENAEAAHNTLQLFYGGHIHLVREVLTMTDFYALKDAIHHPNQHIFLFENFEAVLQQPLPKQKEIEAVEIILKKGESIKIYQLFDVLEKVGYTSAKERILQPGEFYKTGDQLFIWPVNKSSCYRINLFGDEIEDITTLDQTTNTDGSTQDMVTVLPQTYKIATGTIMDLFHEAEKSTLFLNDDLDEIIETGLNEVKFTTFPKESEIFYHLNFFSVLPYYTLADCVTDIKERLRREYRIVILTKKHDEVVHLCKEYNIMHCPLDTKEPPISTVLLQDIGANVFLPHSFQNNDQKFVLLTDREIFQFARQSKAKKAIQGMNTELMSSLKPGNFVIHQNHGLAQYDGIIRRLVTNMGEREYLKLCYAGNDKLFIPVESAETVTKFIGDDNPKLTKLGSTEWQKIQKRINKETERIAGELLKLYAKREMSKRKAFVEGDEMLQEFCDSFPYELTPGQAQTWYEIERDMEGSRPMDRLVCGDVGFGKTEMAMRAAFKCFRGGRQCALLAPITILAEQHYESFMKRIADKQYGINIALLSRFQTAAEQKEIVQQIKLGMVDIVIGTHRLLSKDIQFHDLGLMIVDEEQRFGVQQKEHLKRLRSSIDILTLTATPIPRTLNMSLNKLKDISTITTPPPGRLPVVTEVRKFNLNLIRERIQHEIDRGGQVYFLHNRVQTIEAITQQLRTLMPEISFIVAHGQLSPVELEARIKTFKNKEAQVLVASTIIENGIDLDNANTLFVNRAEQFGLSQLYQLRGRVGRGRTQAYAYFLYQGQRLSLDAKKRLRAIVEASELGSGFQIAMRDLEIRGAGELLGASQSGAMKTVGVSHFMRMLHKTIEKMKAGEITDDITEQEENITVEVPLSAYIPPGFIPNTDEKIQVYQELAGAANIEHLQELRHELRDDYGTLPIEVENLIKVIKLKLQLRSARLGGVRLRKISHKQYEVVLRMGKGFTPDQIFELIKHSPRKWVVTATALKLQLTTLPVQWYDNLADDIELLTPQQTKNATAL